MTNLYFIREKYHLHFNGDADIEIHDEKTDPHSNKIKSLKAVNHFIKEWLELWLENTKDGGHTFLGGETDFFNYAKCRIKNESGNIDKFELKIIAKKKALKDKYVYKFSKNGEFKKHILL